MADVGLITGSGFYNLVESSKEEIVDTKYGKVPVTIAEIEGKQVAHISRHGKGHETLSTGVNHRAHIAALKELGVKLIIGTTVCGITNPKLELTKLLIFEDMFFPDNKLQDGSFCTFYTESGDKERGHAICEEPFSTKLIEQLKKTDLDAYYETTYCYVNGPRFNTKKEIKFYAQYGDAVSQTAAPEAVLSSEVEIPYILIGYGTDYANGVMEEPTPIDVLLANFQKSKETLMGAIKQVLKQEIPEFEGFVFRFEKRD